ASRIGQDGNVAGGPQADPDLPNTASVTAPSGADLTQLQKLGDIGGVDLGARDGGCTLMVGKDEMLIAGAPDDASVPGKAVVRVGDSLVLTDAAAGGLDAIRDGTSFAGEGFTVSVAPAASTEQRRPANVTVIDAAGKTQSYSGNWICS
ncbi:hypothetical protein A3718_11640, partial [Erythrobacter sp. HI0019]